MLKHIMQFFKHRFLREAYDATLQNRKRHKRHTRKPSTPRGNRRSSKRTCRHHWVLEPASDAERRPVRVLNEWNPYTGRVGVYRDGTFTQGNVPGYCKKCGATKLFHPFARK